MFAIGEWREDCSVLTEPIDDEELATHLQQLKTAKASGPDGLVGEVLRYLESGSHAFTVLRNILNAVLSTCKSPDSWRESNVWLIFKAGDSTSVSNYRPITLSNVSYKLFMAILTRRLTALLEKHCVLTNAQAGFRARRGCQQKIALSVAIHQHALNTQKPLSCMYVDLAKAYDSIPHDGLWQTFEAMRLPRAFITLMRDIYAGNTVAVLTPYGPTRKIDVLRGLRQGDPASCPFFNIFIDPILYDMQTDAALTGYTYVDPDRKAAAATRLRRRYTRIDDEHRAIRVSHHKFGDTFHARFRGAMCGSP